MAYSNKALPPGTVLREWRLEQVLGVGGFGIVYRGRGIYFDELVAIKEYFPSAISERKDGDTVVPTDSDAEEVHALGLKKFVEEAKLLWNLSKPTRHPNIVSVRSLFEIHGTAYMVMDFEDGVSLSDILKSGKRFTEASLMALIRPISEGLERAHRVGVLHRDIKPPNMLVSEDGRPVLIDFGSARFDAGQATNTKVTFHTPPYAAIEQYVKTYEQGPWTDIYALGVVLYECVTGTKPPEVLERMHGGQGKLLAGQEIEGFSQAFLRGIDAAMTIRPSDRPQTIPEWLEMFDPGYEPKAPALVAGADEAKTRFAAFAELPEEIVPVAPPSILPVEEPQPSAADDAPLVAEPPKPVPPPKRKPPVITDGGTTEPARKRLRPMAIGAAVAVIAVLSGGGYVMLSGDGSDNKASAISDWIPAIVSPPRPLPPRLQLRLPKPCHRRCNPSRRPPAGLGRHAARSRPRSQRRPPWRNSIPSWRSCRSSLAALRRSPRKTTRSQR
jgi:serine/threonine protein kinase